MGLNIILKNIGLFLLLVFLQVFLLDNIFLTRFDINPNFYILFLLLLPFETPGWLLLVLAFFLGLTVDVFADTAGIGAGSLLFAAFLRPLFLKILQPRDGYAPDTVPSIGQYGIGWFFKYSVILIFVQNLVYQLLIVFSFAGFLVSLYKALLGTFFVLLLVFLSQFLFGKKISK